MEEADEEIKVSQNQAYNAAGDQSRINTGSQHTSAPESKQGPGERKSQEIVDRLTKTYEGITYQNAASRIAGQFLKSIRGAQFFEG